MVDDRVGATGGWNAPPANTAGRFRTTPRASGDGLLTGGGFGADLAASVPGCLSFPRVLSFAGFIARGVPCLSSNHVSFDGQGGVSREAQECWSVVGCDGSRLGSGGGGEDRRSARPREPANDLEESGPGQWQSGTTTSNEVAPSICSRTGHRRVSAPASGGSPGKDCQIRRRTGSTLHPRTEPTGCDALLFGGPTRCI